jgi:hypothetical protein
LVDAQGRIRYSVNASIDWNTPQVKAIINQMIQEQTSPNAKGSKPLPPAK